jgi:tetratricopeptide (TPR) repeat protein
MKLARFTSRWLVAFAGMLVCQLHAVAAGNEYMRNLGEQYFKQGQYQDAANILAIASSESPKDPYVHYLRAGALAKLRQNAEAAAEYRLCITLDRSGTIRQYSQQMLETLIPSQKAKAKSKPVSDATTPEDDEATRQRLTAECDAMIEKINKAADEKRKALEREKQARMTVNGQPLEKLASNQAVEKEFNEKFATLHEQEMNEVSVASAFYARKLAALKRP